MKKANFLFIFLAFSILAGSQDMVFIHKTDKIANGIKIEKIDSITFINNGFNTIFYSNGNQLSCLNSEVDSLSIGNNPNNVSVSFKDGSATITNPYAYEGVTVTKNGSDVTIISVSEIKDLNFNISGNTTDGSVKFYSLKAFNLNLNGVSIINQDGPAINIQSGKAVTVNLKDGTTNILGDGIQYSNAPLNSEGVIEDQKATFFSEGQLIFKGTGSLTVNGTGSNSHAICSDDFIRIDGGSITVNGSVKDGIHGKEGITINGGIVNVSSNGDGIDGDEGVIDIKGGNVTVISTLADVNGIKCDSIINVSGGKINISVNGNQSKGLKSKKAMNLTGGEIIINTKGGVVLVPAATAGRYDPSYCTAVKCDADVNIAGANITITATGTGGKGISSDTGVTIDGGTINITTSGAGAKYTNSSGTIDSYNSTCISSNGRVNIISGSITVSGSGSASKGISVDGALNIGNDSGNPTLNVTTTGAKITLSGSGRDIIYAESKAIKCNGAITVNNGTTTINSADDGMKSDLSITINNGTVNINKSTEGMEAPTITVINGNVNLVASDDSFNATKGNGGETNDGSYLYLKGGNIYANSSAGDGLDSNGNIVISGGIIVVHGPQSQPEVGMDYNGTCSVTGGFLVISGTNSNMTQAPGTSSTQYSIKVTSSANISAGTLFHVQNATGKDILTFKPLRSFYSVVFSSSELLSGSSYSIYTGGSSTGTIKNGLYSGGTYSGGTLKKTFTISGKVTTVTF